MTASDSNTSLAQTREWMESRLEQNEFHSWLNIKLVAIDDGHVVTRMDFENRLLNISQQSIQGGILATFIDNAGALAMYTTAEDPSSAAQATIDLDVSYLNPATDNIYAHAEVIRSGSSIGVSVVNVTNSPETDEGDPIAFGRGTYRVWR